MSGSSHLVLVGLMATGKTTVGKLVAHALGWPMLDSDAQVEARTGRTVREIWHADGEAEFRRLEAEALAAALEATEPSVIAAAGGVVLSKENRERLRGTAAHVVWLRARVDTLLERIRLADDVHRPLLDEDPEGMLERMSSDRERHYRAVADRTIDVDDRTPTEIADEVISGMDGPRPQITRGKLEDPGFRGPGT